MSLVKTKNLKLFIAVTLISLSLTLPVHAAETATSGASSLVNFTPWRMNSALMTSATDPHPNTSVPQTMTGTAADTQFGRNLPSGFSQVGLVDATVTSGVADFQNVINRINSTATGTGRLNQLQTEINQNQSQVGYVFNDKFSVKSMTDSSGNLVGQANGNFIQTRKEVIPGGTQTTTCTGAFTWDPVSGFTLTSGTAQGQGSGCTTQ